MNELVDYIVSCLIDKSQYELVIVEDNEKSDIKILVDQDVINRVIGKGGKIAKAIRTLVHYAGKDLDKTYSVFVEER